MIRNSFYFFLVLLVNTLQASAQERPIGRWRGHMPYSNAISAATDGVTVFAVSDESFYTYDAANGELSAYSKVEGMADVAMSYVAYDATSGYAILAYKNGNIDLFKDETFFNIPDIKLKSINGLKNIYNIYTENGTAYLSTSFGIVVLNLLKKETKETYSFISNNQTIEVKEFTAMGNYFYALTSNGLFKANRYSPNLQAFTSWQKIVNKTNLTSIVTSTNKVFVSTKDSLFTLVADTLEYSYRSPYIITHLDSTKNGIWINESDLSTYTGRVRLLTVNNTITDTFKTIGRPVKTIDLADNFTWIADSYNGIYRREGGNNLTLFLPEGPSQSGSFDILPYNGDVWVAHGGYNGTWTPIFNNSGVSHFKDNDWTLYNNRTFGPLRDSAASDFIVLARDPVTQDVYAGAYRSGIVIFKTDGTYEYIADQTRLESTKGDPGSLRIAGLTFDQDNNLWFNQAGAIHDIGVKTKEGNWYKYASAASAFYVAYIITDDYNQKWYVMPNGASAVAVYDDKHTPDNPNDDFTTRLSTSTVHGYVNCIAKDKQGAIWVGTNDGIGIFNCSPEQIAAGSCVIEKPIVQYDQFAGYLFQSEKVQTIAVDGANRKWIGTTNGVWLISPDGDKIINRFTEEDSPLPSNNIQKIAVDPVTGDVYMGTSAGLVSYRGTATEGEAANGTVTTFPNPVPFDYSGTIAIRGVTENADVRITDISGQLVYRTKALGGQAVWNGLDYSGRKPQTGVYLIFVTNKDGTQTHTGKMVFMQ
jgi:hypothetical protein